MSPWLYDPVFSSGGWLTEGDLLSLPMEIMDENGLEEKGHAAHLTALQDREEDDRLIAQRNLLLNLNSSELEDKKGRLPSLVNNPKLTLRGPGWVLDESSLLSSCNILPDTLSEELCGRSLKSCNDSLNKTDDYQEAIFEPKIDTNLDLNKKEERLEALKLVTMQAMYGEGEETALPALKLSKDDWQEKAKLALMAPPILESLKE